MPKLINKSIELLPMTLEQAYAQIKIQVSKNSVESLEVLKQIQEYWNLWKPSNLRVLLLAESHVYTNQLDFNAKFDKQEQDHFIKDYPAKFVRLVYCLGYGEPNLLNEEIGDNSGTTQFWKIFCSCTARTDRKLNFERILKTKTDFNQRLRNKVTILSELKRRGIWLIDASIVGIYKGTIPDPETKESIFHASWDYYLEDLIAECAPEHIVVIGKGVALALNGRLRKVCSKIGASCTVLPQPQGNRGSSEEQMETYREYQRICSKYASDSSGSVGTSPRVYQTTTKTLTIPKETAIEAKQSVGWVHLIRESNEEVQAATKVLTNKISELSNVTSRPSGKNYVFSKGKSSSLSRFVAFMPRKQALAIRIRTDTTSYPDKQGLIGEKTYNWFFSRGTGVERELRITKMEQVEYAFELIKWSYELVKIEKARNMEEKLAEVSERLRLEGENKKAYQESISSPTQFQRNYCQYCGKPVRKNWEFCTNCGGKLLA